MIRAHVLLDLDPLQALEFEDLAEAVRLFLEGSTVYAEGLAGVPVAVIDAATVEQAPES